MKTVESPPIGSAPAASDFHGNVGTGSRPASGAGLATPSAPFGSILFLRPPAPGSRETREPPAFFHDLNLDQVVDAITMDWKDYELAPFYYTTLTDLDTIGYRQEVMQDLEREPVMQSVRSFSQRMCTMRRYLGLATTLERAHEKMRWFLDAARAYCDAVARFSEELAPFPLGSRGMRAFRDYLAAYAAGITFGELLAETTRLATDLSAIRYGLVIRDSSVTVLPGDNGPDYTEDVEAAFEKFRSGAVKDYRAKFVDAGRLNHVEAQILDRVARLNPAVFAGLAAFSASHENYLDSTIVRFDREVQFYIAYLTFVGRLRSDTLTFCYPQLSTTSKEITGRRIFDLALASRLASRKTGVVPNDFFLHGSERVLVVTGPNQGGKTTFARTFGQLHYLASLGCPVPGTEARLFLFDRLLTHFDRVEDVRSLRGKLQDDLIRVREMLDQATPRSIVVINEIFASTTLKDAIYLSRKIMAALASLDLLAVCVTFLDELAAGEAKVVSVVAGVDPNDPTVRTFRLERRPADGLAYALALTEKYRVTYDWLVKRIRT